MPIHRGKDDNGCFYQWGDHGKKYYYVSGNKKSRDQAYEKAKKQAVAIYASGWHEKKK